MSLEPKNRDDGADKNAAKVLHRLTGRAISEFDASDYEIPDIQDQEMQVKEESES